MTSLGSSGGPVSQSDDSKYAAHDIIMKFSVSMALKAALDLGIPDVLGKVEGGKSLTAGEILAQLPACKPDPDSNRRLECLLTPLVWENFFTQSLNDKNQHAYGLTKVSEWFVKENKLNMLPIAEFNMSQESMVPYGHLSKSLLDGAVTPFEDYCGMPGYEYTCKNPEFGRVFQNYMISFSNVEAPTLMDSLQRSGLLEGVETLVDVGGGTGSNVADIIAMNPQIKGINYDLPNVVAEAPVVKGLTHVGGNMFESVPSGDAMFVKWILHNNGDKECLTILKNCFKALPKRGKAIIVEYVLLDDNDRSFKAKIGVVFNLNMMLFKTGAQERTRVEYEKLTAAAGFSRCEFIQSPGSIDLITAFKE